MLCSPAHFSLLASSLKYCQVRSWFSPKAANDPDKGSISAILMVSACAMPEARPIVKANAPSLRCVTYFIESPILINIQPKLPANPCAPDARRADHLVLLQKLWFRGP